MARSVGAGQATSLRRPVTIWVMGRPALAHNEAMRWRGVGAMGPINGVTRAGEKSKGGGGERTHPP